MTGNRPGTQDGSALIMAMLIAGMVAAMAVQFTQTFVLQSSRLESRLLQSRFETYFDGAQVLAAQVLLMDGLASDIDHLQQNWAMELPPFPTDDGWLQVRLMDAQGRFNLNNMSFKTPYFYDAGAPAVLRFTPQQKQFIRLLRGMPDMAVTEAEAVQILEAIVDWLDSDDRVSGTGGAESLYYATRPQPYQPANQWFVDTSELHLVRHMTPALLQQLEPLVVALPALTPLNVNTALPALLGTINRAQALTPLPSEEVQRVVLARQQTAYRSLDEVFDSAVFAAFSEDIERTTNGHFGDVDAGEIPPAVYSVESNYFLLHVTVTIGESTRSMRALLQRSESDVKTVSRYQRSWQ